MLAENYGLLSGIDIAQLTNHYNFVESKYKCEGLIPWQNMEVGLNIVPQLTFLAKYMYFTRIVYLNKLTRNNCGIYNTKRTYVIQCPRHISVITVVYIIQNVHM